MSTHYDRNFTMRDIAKQVLGQNLEYIFSGGAHLDPRISHYSKSMESRYAKATVRANAHLQSVPTVRMAISPDLSERSLPICRFVLWTEKSRSRVPMS